MLLYNRSLCSDAPNSYKLEVFSLLKIMNFKAIFWAVVVAAVVAMSTTVEAG